MPSVDSPRSATTPVRLSSVAPPAIRLVEHLSKAYGGVTVLDDVFLRSGRGEFFTLLRAVGIG